MNLKAIEVGTDVLQLPSDVFVSGDKKGTIIDSGTTLAYLPATVYSPLVNAVWNFHDIGWFRYHFSYENY